MVLTLSGQGRRRRRQGKRIPAKRLNIQQNNKEYPIIKLTATANGKGFGGLGPGRYVFGRYLVIGYSLLFCWIFIRRRFEKAGCDALLWIRRS
jgi:hypothetical protein